MHVDELTQGQAPLHQEVLERLRTNRARMRASGSKASLPHFEVGGNDTVARVSRRDTEAYEHVDGTLAGGV